MSDLRELYDDYLACLNERDWPRLGDYVANELSYNGRRMRLDDYRTMLVEDTRAIPDLRFEAELLVADGDVVASRLHFQCTPERPFLGFEASGQRMSFAEHVFYRFADRRIVSVWSVIDKEAIREQLSPDGLPKSGHA